MAIPVPSSSEVGEKWRQRASSASDEYRQGVTNPRRSWESSTLAGEQNYEQGVQEAIAQNRFAIGVREAGDSKWQSGALEKGVTRFSSGIATGQEDFERGISEVLQVISGVNLPPRGVAGSPQNIERVTAVATALHEAFSR